ncbi:MAG: DUF58 domain-containing protein [Phycisphaerales bacterium]|nr:DUF58 domain-containing protein [Phycisphaerales bacterium]
MPASPKYLDPETIAAMRGLELRAKAIVAGAISGLHRSAYHGFSVEFAEHRQYAPGDDIRYIDWRVFGRVDRFYIKEYEEETNLKAYIILDASKSMAFASDGVSKIEYAKYVAAALTHLVTSQQDAVALVLWDEKLRKFIPPGNNPLHQRDIYRTLSEAEPEGTTDVGGLLQELAERVRQRSLMIILSDLLDTSELSLMKALRHLRHKGHDVIVFHVLDHAELEFPFDRMTRFEGLEVSDHLLADPRALREAYLAEMEGFCQSVKGACMANQMDYVTLDTSRPLDVALSSYLAARAGTR